MQLSWERAKMVGGTAAAIVATMVGWTALDLPRLAWHHEVAEIKQFSIGTRLLVLLDKKREVRRELRSLRSRLEKSPGNLDLRARITDLELEMDTINDQIKKLNEEKS